MKRIVYIVIILASFVGASAQTPPRTPPSAMPMPGQANKPGGPAGKDQGFVSKKTGKPMASAQIEDITNENFPDMIESFDYPNADIGDVVKAISELTGKNFVLDPGAVHGKISIIAPSRLTVAEAYKAFLSALAINGMALVPGDGFIKIKQAQNAKHDNIDTFSGAYYPTSDQMITRIVKLKYISADEVNKNFRGLISKDGDLMVYPPTNSLIISDYGANVDRIMKIIGQLDVQGFEEQMEVIRIKWARSKEIAELIDQIINKGDKKNNQFGVPRFRPAGGPDTGGSTGAEVYSVVVSDDRSNSIIVVGNKSGVEKIRHLIGRLDYPMRPDEQGGVFVIPLRHAEAEPISNLLNGIATESKKALDQSAQGSKAVNPIGAGGMVQPGPAATAIFGGEVKVSFDKSTNSLVVVASKPDYETIRNLVAKLDIAKDQVFIKAYFVEMISQNADSWNVNYYKFGGDASGIGRIGFRGSDNIQTLLTPAGDQGGVLGFGTGGVINMTIGGQQLQVPSLSGLLNILKTNGATNILQTPQVMALNNEEALIEVGSKVPVSKNDTPTTGGVVASNISREDVTTKLVITPYISPDTDSVKMKIEQNVSGLGDQTVVGSASELAKNSIVTTTRKVKTQIVVNSGDTAVLGGMVLDTDKDTEVKIPVLGDIPILGWLFKNQNKTKDKTNLMVFITPRILRSASDSETILEEKLSDRIDFIQRSMNGRDPHGHYFDAIRTRKTAKPEVKPEQQQEAPAVETF